MNEPAARSNPAGPNQPLFALASPTGRWLMATSVLGAALVGVEATVVNVALPTLGARLDADIAALQWVLNGYLLSLASLILLAGSLSDRLGTRRVFLWGTGLFTLTSAMCAVAPNVQILIAARVLQGVGAALLTPGSLALLEELLRPQDRARAIGTWSAFAAVSGAIGPLLGGWLTQLSWRWVFLIPVPLGVAVLIAAARIPEARQDQQGQRVDYRGAILATTALGALTFGLVQAQAAPPALTATVVTLGLLAAAAFLRVERRTPAPMLPLGLFGSRVFAAANAITFVIYSALGAVFFLFIVYLQTGLGYSPTQAGAASLPITLVMLALSSKAGDLAQRIGLRTPLTVGPLLVAAGMLLMTRINPNSPYLTDVLPALVVFGLGLAATVAPVTTAVLGDC